MYRKLIKAMRCMAVALGLIGACIPSYLQAATATFPLKVDSAWKDTGIQVAAGDSITVQAKKILRLQDGISINSNGEWLYCWNKKFYTRGDKARTDVSRPLPGAPGGALIFRIGSGQPFFVPRSGGNPGNNATSALGVDAYAKLPGFSGAPLSHQFVAQESGVLYVNINLSDAAKREDWNWRDFTVTVLGKLPTECQVSGKIVDEAGRALADAEVQIGSDKKLSGADGTFLFLVPKDGKYPIKAAKTGYLPSEKAVTVSLALSGALDAGSVVLRGLPGRLSGKVLSEDGKIVAGATVRIGPVQAATDRNGNFSAQVNKGIYEVKASKTMSSGMAASGGKENVEVLPGQATDAGSIAIAPTIGGAAGWLATARMIQKGQTVVVKAGGEISKAPFRFGPDGTKGKPGGYGSFLPGEAWGALVAKIGAGKPFIVGAEARFPAPAAGVLYFGVNLSPAESKGMSGTFIFKELTVLDLGDLEGTVLGNGKPLTMATVEVSGIKEPVYTDADGKFLLSEIPANKVYTVTIKFPGYNAYNRSLALTRGQRATIGKVTLQSAPITGTVAIKMLPKTGTTGGIIPVFVEATNTSVRNGLWGGYLVSLKAKAMPSGKEYPGMSPTYLILSPGEKRGTELLCQLPASAPAGLYTVTAELRAPETSSIQDASKQFDARKELEDKLSAMKEVKGRLVGQNAKTLNVVKGVEGAGLSAAARLLLPTITPKVFSPSKGQVVTGNIALREKSVMVMGKEVEIFRDKNGEPLLIWNYYEGLYLSEREDGTRKDDWISLGQSNVKADDFTVNWDTSKFKDGDYQIKATMKTTYDGKPIEGSMTLMVKVRNDPRTGSIRGKVIDEAGLPLYNVAVKRQARGQAISGVDWTNLGTKSEVEWQAEDVVMTNPKGEFVFSGVLSGDAKLQFSLDKYSQGSADVVLKPGQALTVASVVLEADKCTLTGTVKLNDGAKAAGVAVSLAGPTAFTGSVGEDGNYSFAGAKKGGYRAFVSKDDYDPAYVDFSCAPGEAKAIPGLLLRRKLYALTGTVKDEAGTPLAGVIATLDKTVSRTITDKNGKFSIWNVLGGNHALAFTKARYETAESQFETPRSTAARAVQVEVVLKPAKGALTGKVIPAAAQAFIDGGEIQLANGGRYEAALTPGEHTITVSKKAFETFEKKVAVLSGETLALDIKLEPARGDFKLKVEPKDAQVSLDGTALENKDGEVRAQVPPGKHLLLVQAQGRQAWEKEIEVGSAEEVAMAVTLPFLPGGIQGSVTPFAAKLEIAGVKVNADAQNGVFRKELPPGKHLVSASHGNLEPFQAEIEVSAGEFKLVPIALEAKKARPDLSLTASLVQAYTGQPITLTVQTPDGNTDVELAAGKGKFEGTETNSLTGRTDANGRFEAKWASLTPAKHKIRLKAGKGAAIAEKEIELDVKYITPEVDAAIRKVKGSVNLGENFTVEAQVRNIGKVNGKYRFELELRGTGDLPLFILRPVEMDLEAGESKPVKFDWNVTALGEYTAKLVVSIVGDSGELRHVNTFQGKLSFTTIGEMTGLIQVVGGKLKFSPEVRGMKMDYQVSDPGGLDLKKFDGELVKGQCEVLKQVGNKGEIIFTKPPQKVK